MITVTCTQCGATVERKPYHAAMTANPFCGFACYAAWQKVHRVGVGKVRQQVPCTTCGAVVEKQPSEIADHNFCSRACWAEWRSSEAWAGTNNPAWMGGHSQYRGPNWMRQSRAARARDANTCQRCGITGASFPVHHKRPFHLFSDYREANMLDNLVTLCSMCHGITEGEFWQAHPDLQKYRQMPDCVPTATCSRCAATFTPRSGVARLCDACCSATCAHCGQGFYSRKASHRTIKYCSRACRNADVKAHSRPRKASSPTT